MCSTIGYFLRETEGYSGSVGMRLEHSVGSVGIVAPFWCCFPFVVAETERAWAERLLKTRVGP